MTLRGKLLAAVVLFLAVVVTPPLSFFLYGSLDAPPPHDADFHPRREDLAKTWRWDHLLAVDGIGRVRRGDGPIGEYMGWSLYGDGDCAPLPFHLHPNRTKAVIAESCRTLADASTRPYQEGQAIVADLENRLAAITKRFEPPWDLFQPNAVGLELCTETPWHRFPFGLRSRAHAELQSTVTRLVLVLRAYKAEHGRLPETLQALVPEYLDAAPPDPFDEQPIRYDPQKGIVYSVGEDGVDTGGHSHEELENSWLDAAAAAGKLGIPGNPARMPDPSFLIDE